MINAMFSGRLLVLPLLSALSLTGCETEAPPRPQAAQRHHTGCPQTGSSARTAASGICDYQLDESALTAAGWTRIFDESFSNLNQWNVWTGGAYNNELQYYQAPNLQLSSGNLLISARQETATGRTTPYTTALSTFQYTSGRLESKTLFSAGKTNPRIRMMARLKLPPGYGMWPAFWSYGDSWPTQGEIDILEARGQEPFTYYTAYWYGRAPGKNLVQNSSVTITSTASLQDCWHVYEVIWEKNTLTYLLDGQVVDVKSGGYIPNMFGKQQKLTLNLAVGGDFFGPSFNPAQIQTGTLEVDWVKVFRAR